MIGSRTATRLRLGLRLLMAATLAVGGAAQAAPPPSSLLVGAAKIEVTPRGAAVDPALLVRDPLYVRVVFVRSGGSCAVLVGVDKALVPTKVVDAVRARIMQCPSASVVVSATHTHSAADLPTGWLDPAAGKILEDAIVLGAREAAGRVKRARMGFATTDLHLNVNRDAFDGRHWLQASNPEGPSDRIMSVLSFVGDDDLPIAMVMNYGMHPIDFFLSGVISADFPGEASRYVERRYDGAVAIFTQGASGDQNPLLSRPLGKLMGPRLAAPVDDRVGAPSFWEKAASDARERPGAKSTPAPASKDWNDAYRANVAEAGEIVSAMGAIIGESAILAMRERGGPLSGSAPLWSGAETVTCPGRDRIETAHREGIDPGYRDGAPVKISVDLLRIGDVALVGVDSELYAEIVQHLKARSPLRQTMVIGLANGLANSGYIYSDAAAHHLTFQVIGSRLKPGCAEGGIIDAALSMIGRSGSSRD